MKTIYIRRLDGTIIEYKRETLLSPIIFYKNGMCKVNAPDLTYLLHNSNIEIISDSEEELDNDGF